MLRRVTRSIRHGLVSPRKRAPVPSESGPRRVLVVNAYSTLNLGDAVILDGLITALRAAGAEHITVAVPGGDGREVARRMAMGADDTAPMVFDLVRSPRFVRRFFLVHAVWTLWNLALVAACALLRPTAMRSLRAYLDADLVVSSGGAYLGGPRAGINALTLFQIVIARVLGRTCVVAPVTVKPMSSIVTAMVTATLRGMRVFGRDQATVARLAALGVGATLSSDLAFRSRAAAEFRAAAPKADGLVVAVAPRQFGWDSEAYALRNEIAEATAAALTALVREQNARLLVITQSSASNLEYDPEAIDRLLPMLPPDAIAATEVLPIVDGIDAALLQYARADVALTYRLHAGILALRAGTPSLVLDYEPKVRGVLGMVDLHHWVLTPGDASNPRRIVERLTALRQTDEVGRIHRALRIAEDLAAPFETELVRRLHRAGNDTTAQ
jgi:polysaccharide pyruvyl transferase WcaK-like protein